MVPLVALIALQIPGPIDQGDRIVAAGRTYLQTVGVPGPLQLVALNYDFEHKTWFERFLSRWTRTYDLNLSDAGLVTRAHHGDEKAPFDGLPAEPPVMSLPQFDRRVRTILEPLRNGYQAAPATYRVDRLGNVRAWAPLLLNGKPLFNHVGWSVAFKAKSGAFVSVLPPRMTSVDVPDVKPDTSPSEAYREAASVLTSFVVPPLLEGKAKLLSARVSPRAILGYYDSGEGRPFPVWLLPYRVDLAKGNRHVRSDGTLLLEITRLQRILANSPVPIPEPPGLPLKVDPAQPGKPSGDPKSLLAPYRIGMTSDRAIELARKALAAAGESAELFLDGLGKGPGGVFGNEDVWKMGFRIRPDAGYNVQIDSRTGSLLLFTCTSNLQPTAPLISPGEATRMLALQLLRRLVPTEPVGAPTMIVGVGAGAEFPRLKNGHPFFNENPFFGYRITFHSDSGRLVGFERSPDLPPVNAANSRVTAGEALNKLETFGRAHVAPQGSPAKLNDPRSGWIRLEPQLGYFKYRSEPKARLVWQGMRMAPSGKLKEAQYGPLRVFVDALSGKLLVPDDPAIL